MKPETPAEGIMKINDHGNSKCYHVVCGCQQPDHALTVEVEADEMGVTVNTYITAQSDYWGETFVRRFDIDNTWLQACDWFWKDAVNGIVRRLKLTWTVWTKGYVETQTTILMSEQQAINYANTLTSAVKDVKIFRDNTLKDK